MTDEDKNENEEAQETETKEPTEDTQERNEPEARVSIDDANLAAKRLEDANKEKRSLLDREEKLLIEKKLGGESSAGQVPEKPKGLTPKEYKDAVMRGEIPPKD